MTRLAFLSSGEQQKFDSPPTFTKDQRPAYFIVSDEIRRTLSNLRSDTHKIGFLLQLGYFKSAGKFYVPAQFRHKDIKYVKQLLNITADPDFDDYDPSRVIRHRKRILQLLRNVSRYSIPALFYLSCLTLLRVGKLTVDDSVASLQSSVTGLI
jgi:hypothetical protein